MGALVAAEMTLLAERIEACYRAESAADTGLTDPLVPDAADTCGRQIALTLVELLTSDGETMPDTVRAMRELGADHAWQGLSVEAVVQAYQVGPRVLWSFVMERLDRLSLDPTVVAGLMADLGRQLMDFTSAMTGAVAAGMIDTTRYRSAGRERLTAQLLEQLLAGRHRDRRSVEHLADAMDFPLGDLHAVAVLALLPRRHAHTGPVEPVLRRRAGEALGRALPGEPLPIVQARGQATVAVLPLRRRVPLPSLVDWVHASLELMLGDDVGYQAALGGVEPGVEGIAISYRQARAGLAAVRSAAREGVHGYLTLLPRLLLDSDAVLAGDLSRATLDLVLDDAEGAQLVEVLTVFFEERGSVQAAAKRLHMHRHTLSTRLRRVEDLTGLSLGDSDHRLLLQLCLRLPPPAS